MFQWNTSPFLQALGWATLNSIWQMALLWCSFLLVLHFFKFSSTRKYQLATSSIFFGFGWFVYTFIVYYLYETKGGFSVALPFLQSVELLPIVLSAASVAYLCLLIFPAYRIFKNWKFIQRIKKEGLQKATYRHRLFVQKIGRQLGITKSVKVYLSHLVTSPVTVGFLKPLILLPFAAIANLSVQQIEAVLLHELSHIRRQDYLVNLLITTIHVVLYFNPFVKFFIKRVDLERESCCDEMVLQFEYDQMSYASALLELEKNSQNLHLAMAAANKNHLLHRIEKIVGIKRKSSFKTAHFAGAFGGLLMLMIINTVIIAGKQNLPTNFSVSNFSHQIAFFANEKAPELFKPEQNIPSPLKNATYLVKQTKQPANNEINKIVEPQIEVYPVEPSLNNEFMHVAFDEVDAFLDKEQKDQVSKTVENTKKVLKIQWQEVQKAIGDDMTAREKRMAKQEYLKEIEQINWSKMEQNLKATYEQLDWNKINSTVAEAMTTAKLDSIENCYTQTLTEINKLKTCKPHELAIPDVSVQQVQKTKAAIKLRIEEIQKVRTKKIIRL
jgi:beta-lactamase regulating signal transducer with metallopeptidase domain